MRSPSENPSSPITTEAAQFLRRRRPLRVLVAMSGGVDSSVAAWMLQQEGHEVVGMTMRVHDDAASIEKKRSCCAPKDIYDARSVADRLGIPYYAVDLRESFRESVIEPFARSYAQGLTPSPCVTCNSHFKFGLLFQRARALGFDAVATGHFAQIRAENPGEVQLLRGVDRQKDQSYFLFAMRQDQLRHCLFPLGHLTKAEVRELARSAGLETAEKPESQEICFVPDGDYARVVDKTLQTMQTHQHSTAGQGSGTELPNVPKPGLFVDREGRPLGEHKGVHHFTIGQRRGLGVSQPRPLYVVGIHPERETVVLGTEEDLLVSACRVGKINWLSPNAVDSALSGNLSCQVAIRSRHQAAPALLRQAAADKPTVDVQFVEPQRAVTPGQAAVFYLGDEVLGGGWIERSA